MATVTGTIRGIDDEESRWMLTFVPQDTPGAIGGNIAVALDKRVVTDAVGAFSVDLLEGRYTVKVNNGEEFEIDVPSGSSTHDIEDLIDPDDEAPVTPLSGNGSPEGVVTAIPGRTYWDRLNKELYIKDTGTGNTGWRRFG